MAEPERGFYQPRLRRECLGELMQIDGSEHRWFEQRGEPCTLPVFIDDATSKLMQLRLVASESTDSYFAALQGYLEAHGCPVAFYSDKHTVFRVSTPDAKGGQGMTQFDRALAELGPRPLLVCSSSLQATCDFALSFAAYGELVNFAGWRSHLSPILRMRISGA